MVQHCLDFAGISLEDVDTIVVNDNFHDLSRPVVHPREVRIGHHASHAWAAVGLNGFAPAAVLVVDGEGSFVHEISEAERKVCTNPDLHCLERESAYLWDGQSMVPIRKWTNARAMGVFFATSGIAGVYWFLSHLFFGRDQQESKVMGLVAYADPDPCFDGILSPAADGEVHVKHDWLFGLGLQQERMDACFAQYASLAASVQKQFEAAVLHKARWLKNATGAASLCYIGGGALNCVANSKLYNAGIFDRVFVPFGAGDSANAIGCAYYGLHMSGSAPQPVPARTAYLGQPYEPERISAAIARYEKAGLVRRSDEASPAKIARALAGGEVVAWYQGRSEFGPRALGNRSILADPRDPAVRAKLNERVKFRETFRPFGATVLEDRVGEWFESVVPGAHFMQFVAHTRADKKSQIPAITHVDGTSRIQTIAFADNPRLYNLIEEFAAITGVPALLNTSFNIAEPIVETPEDALKTFLCSRIDRLVMEGAAIFRTANVVESANEIAEGGGDLVLIWHCDIELTMRLSDSSFVAQPANGLDIFRDEGYPVRRYRFSEAVISRDLYSALCRLCPIAHGFYTLDDPVWRAGGGELLRELYEAVCRPRMASIVCRTG
jgi:carbamoyltransferase